MCQQGAWRSGKGLWLAYASICEWWLGEPVWAEARQSHFQIPRDQPWEAEEYYQKLWGK